jgi:hypothetical protein
MKLHWCEPGHRRYDVQDCPYCCPCVLGAAPAMMRLCVWLHARVCLPHDSPAEMLGCARLMRAARCPADARLAPTRVLGFPSTRAMGARLPRTCLRTAASRITRFRMETMKMRVNALARDTCLVAALAACGARIALTPGQDTARHVLAYCTCRTRSARDAPARSS